MTLTQETVQALFEYRDGDLHWKARPPNLAVCGTVAGYRNTKDSYWRVVIKGSMYLKHRLVFLYHYGHLPKYVDHINGNREDCIQMFACHFLTPVDQRTCVQHWLCIKNSPSDPVVDQRLLTSLRFAFNEDKLVLEAIQRNEDKSRQWNRTTLGLDASSIKMRRIVEEMAAAN